MGAVIVRVAVATGTDVDVVRRKPYARTLWTFLHLEQRDYLDSLREKSRAIYAASLMSFAVNEPKGLAEEHRRLMVDAGLTVPVDTSREQALAFAAEISRVDRSGAWTPMGDVS